MSEKILVVDDDIDTLRLVGLMLQRQNYQILAASSGLQALALAQSELPDLILLDIMMPEMDGYEVTRRLRANSTTADIPIIMFSAKSQVDDKILGFEAGADDYLTKPTQPRELIAHMKAVLARSKRSRSAPAAPVQRGYVVGILAARGGLGVSTLALNLGIALFKVHKKEVIVADFRPGQGTIGIELGYNRLEGFNQLLEKEPAEIQARDIETSLMAHPAGPRLLLSSSNPLDTKYMGMAAQFEAIARQLPQLASYVVLDLGCSLSPIVEAVIPHCNEFILVVEPSPQTLMQSKALMEALRSAGIGDGRMSYVLLNRIRSSMQLSLTQVQEQLGSSASAVFTPVPEMAYQAANSNIPLINQQPGSTTAQQFITLAEKVAQRSG